MHDGRSTRLLFNCSDDDLPLLDELIQPCIGIFAALSLFNNRLTHSQLLHFVNLWIHVLQDRRGKCRLTIRHAVLLTTEEYAQVWTFTADVASFAINRDSKEAHRDVGTFGFNDRRPIKRCLPKSVHWRAKNFTIDRVKYA